MTIASELQALTPSAKVEFFVVDATALGAAEPWYFHNGTNLFKQPVVWQGQEYAYVPVSAQGFELRADGPRPRPNIGIGDAYGEVGALMRLYEDLSGAKLLRRRTHVRYLDAVNFPGGVNPSADPTAEYREELWFFDRVLTDDGTVVVWELVSPLDLEGVLIPARQVRSSGCGSRYRSSECGYTGGPVAKEDDTATSDPALDACSRSVMGCKLRFGADAELPIDFFPGAGLVRAM